MRNLILGMDISKVNFILSTATSALCKKNQQDQHYVLHEEATDL